MKINLGTAIKEFGITEFVIDGNPTNEAEFAEMFKLVVGKDASGMAVFSDDLSTVNFTWADVKAKYDTMLASIPITMLREVRNEKLAETDFWELPSQQPMSEERSSYRQALRDITNTYTSLTDVVWPTKPENN